MPFNFQLMPLFLIFQIAVTGQNIGPIVKKFEGSRQISEQYYVLKSNKSIKNGAYKAYFRLTKDQNQQIRQGLDSLEHYVKQKGGFENGQKSGEWIEYSQPGIFYAKGSYIQDKKVGIWITSMANGEVLEYYDHDAKRRLEPVINIPIGYPAKARRSGKEGLVIVQYQLSADCTLTNIRIVQSLSAECDAAAIFILRKYFRYLQTYGTPASCTGKIDTFQVKYGLIQE